MHVTVRLTKAWCRVPRCPERPHPTGQRVDTGYGMSLQNISKSAVRIGKNYIKGYTDTQIKVREATSNDPWGPSGAQLNELSQLSHNPSDFIEMMEILDKRLNDKGKNWRHVFKALSVLDYLLTSGSENVWNYFHDNIYIVKTLREFQYVDDANIDQGINVRQKAKDITALLLDDSRMRHRRRMRMEEETRSRAAGDYTDDAGRRRRQREQERMSAEDRELEQALAESRRMAQEEEERRRREAEDESNLQQALRASREEEEKRKQNETLIDLDKEESASLQPQYTSFIPFQATGFNPFFQAQMQQQEMLQQQYLQQQEYQRQLALQQAAQQYQYMMTQQPAMMMPQPTSFGSNNPWLSPSAPAPAPAPEPASQKTDTLINLDGSEEEGPEDPEPMPKPKPQGPPRAKVTNMNPELNRLLASGDGVDTFGNTGDMRLGPNAAMWHQAMQQQRTGQAGSNPFAK